ncbi:NUDIX domain-containing protein [Methylobacterium sp. NEAU 140]|uniref:NUDIX hydrolase n=1 Tax=Methylobacterium sp. NEAU 140 TaxID=3064945 RepID=UPI002732E264|nr:NUDIX domain-containing protein [Methylobacterium sp. NEAU 140]MDP4024302.1 NUDIX domain-containing protein [Methylobacterium sp. NEAU 140]
MSPSSASLPVRHIARAIVLDPADRILLIAYSSVHARGPDGAPLRFWFLPGGGLEPGEDHVTACRRELGEEIGREDAEIGPQVAACDGPFHLFRQSRDARERYFLVRLPDDRVDTSRLAETEDNPVFGTRWWSIPELRAAAERVEPAGLTDLAARLIAGTIPAEPVVLTWNP